MLFLSNIHGTLTQLTNEPVYRGSSGVNDIVLLAPFARTSVVALYITLPDGVELEPQFATLVNNTADLGVLNTAGKPLNAWKYSLPFVLTEKSGDLLLTFSVTHENGTVTASEIVIKILPGSGFIDPGEMGEGFASIQQAVLAAQTAAADAENSADLARGYMDAADSSANQADSRASDAESAASSAALNRSQAESAKNEAVSAKNAAQTSETNAYLAEGSARDARDRAEGYSISAGLEANRAQTEANRAASEANRAQGYAESINVDNLIPKSAFDRSTDYTKRYSSESYGLWVIQDLYSPFPDNLAGLFNVLYSITAVDNTGAIGFIADSNEIVYADELTVTESYDANGEIISLAIGSSAKFQQYLQENPDKTITATLNLRVILKTL